jgi:hypothetical protein
MNAKASSQKMSFWKGRNHNQIRHKGELGMKSLKTTSYACVAITVVALILLTLGGHTAVSSAEKTITVESSPASKPVSPESAGADLIAEAERIRNPNEEFKITLGTLDAKANYTIGEAITFEFSTDRDCYVTLVNVGSDNETHVLFPNIWNKSHQVKKGEVYRIPADGSNFRFRIGGPPGVDHVKAVATLEPLVTEVDGAMQKAIASNETFARLADPMTALGEFRSKLGVKDKKTWTETSISLNVVEPK